MLSQAPRPVRGLGPGGRAPTVGNPPEKHRFPGQPYAQAQATTHPPRECTCGSNHVPTSPPATRVRASGSHNSGAPDVHRETRAAADAAVGSTKCRSSSYMTNVKANRPSVPCSPASQLALTTRTASSCSLPPSTHRRRPPRAAPRYDWDEVPGSTDVRSQHRWRGDGRLETTTPHACPSRRRLRRGALRLGTPPVLPHGDVERARNDAPRRLSGRQHHDRAAAGSVSADPRGRETGGGRLAGSVLHEVDRLLFKRHPLVLGAGMPAVAAPRSGALPFTPVDHRVVADGTTVTSYERMRST